MSFKEVGAKLHSFFKNNEGILKLPIIVDSGKDVQDVLTNRWDQYRDLIKKHDALAECIPIIEKSIQLINKSVEAYYNGDFVSATKSMSQLVDKLQKKNELLS